jgi:DNA repair protein RecO (recombination protein O)
LDFFSSVRDEIERLTYANYIIELLDAVTTDNDPNEGLYDLLYEVLKMMNDGVNAKKASIIFEARLLDLVGMGINLKACSACGSADLLKKERVSFSAKLGGVICGDCHGRDSSFTSVPAGVIDYMRMIREPGLNGLDISEIPPGVGAGLETILRRFIGYHIARPLKSLEFLKEVMNEGSFL